MQLLFADAEGGLTMRQRMIKRAKELTACRTVYVVRRDGKIEYLFQPPEKTDLVIDVLKTRLGEWCW